KAVILKMVKSLRLKASRKHTNSSYKAAGKVFLTVDMILEGAADFCENVLSPLNQSGDLEGCHFENGEVTTPKGFKEAYEQFVQGGWQGLS
ncbi:hypothetical protein D9B85_15175, partial [Corynebacterium diphtheriae]